jgi:hypothetical protein
MKRANPTTSTRSAARSLACSGSSSGIFPRRSFASEARYRTVTASDCRRSTNALASRMNFSIAREAVRARGGLVAGVHARLPSTAVVVRE